MKSTKNILMTIVALTVALFATVQVSAMNTNQQQINDLEKSLKSQKVELAYSTGMRDEMERAQSKGIKLSDAALNQLAFTYGKIFGLETTIKQTQAKIDALKKK